MRICLGISKCLVALRPRGRVERNAAYKDGADSDISGPPQWTLRLTKARQDFLKARSEAKARQFHRCLDTLDKAISSNDEMYYTEYLMMQTYALFRLGRDEEAKKTAEEACARGAGGFARDLARGDASTRARLRAALPICNT